MFTISYVLYGKLYIREERVEDRAYELAREEWEFGANDVTVDDSRTNTSSIICSECGGWRDNDNSACEQCEENIESWF